MNEFIRIALTFPPALFSLLMIVVVVYWLMVIVGVLDLDLFDVDVDIDLGGLADGAADGLIDGALDGAMDGALDGAIDGAAEGGLEAGATAGAKFLSAIFSSLSLGKVPVTISFSAFTLIGWLSAFAALYYSENALGGTPGWGLRSALFAGAFVAGLVGAGLAVRPLRGLFKTKRRHAQETLVGQVCVVTTGRVDDRFGQANFEDGGAGLILPVRSDDPDNGIARGDRVLIIGYDEERSIYHVEPYEAMLGPGKSTDTALDFDSSDFDTRLATESPVLEHSSSASRHSTGGQP